MVICLSRFLLTLFLYPNEAQVTNTASAKKTQRPIPKKSRQNKRAVLDDITRIAILTENENEETPSKTVNERDEKGISDDDEAIDDCDDDFGGLHV